MSSAPPIVSVIVPTKNRLALLREAIASVQAQTLANWELLVVDDGSDDDTELVVRDMSLVDSRIRFVARVGARAGANVCRNQGIEGATAQLLVFLDSDDLLAPFCLESRVAMMSRNADLDFVVSRAEVFTARVGDLCRPYHHHGPGDDLLRFLTLECPWQTSGPIWRKHSLETIGMFDEGLLSLQDLELHVRAICLGARYIVQPICDHYIRWQEDPEKTSVKHFRDPEYLRAAEESLYGLLNTVDRHGHLTWSRRRALAGLGFGNAECWARIGCLREALTVWRRICEKMGESTKLFTAGWTALFVVGLCPGRMSLGARIVNRFKGAVRFRQEPTLLTNLRQRVNSR